jgi:lathosterol oxidase
MDLILKLHDDYILTPYVYPTSWNEDWWVRQYLSLFAIVTFDSYVMYLVMSGLVYLFVFDKCLMNHPKYLKVSS